MTTLLLVHGAWHQGSSWERVRLELELLGHTVHTPSLRCDPAVRLADHVDQLIDAVDAAGEPVTVVAHSYAGLPAAQAATRAGRKVERLVLVDGWLAPAGKSLLDVVPEWFRSWCLKEAAGDPLVLPIPPLSSFGVSGPDAPWLSERLVAQPLAPFTDPVEVGLDTAGLDLHAVLCVPSVMPFRDLAQSAGATLHEIETGHDVMVTRPYQLAALLDQIAT
ncbi:alpha/beta fold hydrolase [Kribbella sp. NPDC048915]|uniref:alpha/beta fold hydrolase n=1 Tax=Kribbella sp. NPDC048915 TaxID=3155148 RepID=UPI0033FC9911